MSSPKERLEKAADDLYDYAAGVIEAIHQEDTNPEVRKADTEVALEGVKEKVKEIEEIIR